MMEYVTIVEQNWKECGRSKEVGAMKVFVETNNGLKNRMGRYLE